MGGGSGVDRDGPATGRGAPAPPAEGVPWAAIGTPPAPTEVAAPDASRGAAALAGVARYAPVVVVLAAAVYGGLLRVWLLAHQPLFGDESVVGLMGQAIGSGHVNTFYWGQHYGGLEPYVVAAVLKAVHAGPVGLNGTPMLLAALAAVVVGAIVAEATGNGRLAALAGAAVWVWPYAAVWNSVREIGFRGAVLVCGLVLVLSALRIHRGRARAGSYFVLGLAGGLGWWASPEIVYFAVPTAVLLVAAWARLGERRGAEADPAPRRVAPVVLAGFGALLGALPWIYTNARTSFASLRPGSLPSSGGVGYAERLRVFFADVLPTQLGLRSVPGGAWVGGPTIGPLLYAVAVAAVVAAVAWALVGFGRTGRRGAPLLAASAGVVVFPFLYAAFPTSGAWLDGRYGVFLPPLLAVLGALAVAGPALDEVAAEQRAARERPVYWSKAARIRQLRGPRRQAVVGRWALIGASAFVVLAGATTVGAAHEGAAVPLGPQDFFVGWSDPDAAARHVVARMEAAHLRAAYGDYWTAYNLDFLAPGRLQVSPSPLDYDRWPAMAAAVAAAPHPAWLFFAPAKTAAAARAFNNPQPGPGRYTEASFEALLTAQHVPYRVVHLGVLDAVVPAHKFLLAANPPG